LAAWATRSRSSISSVAAGVCLATAVSAIRAFRSPHATAAVASYRAQLARSTLLGLEFLVAADIVGTVTVQPTLSGLGVLAGTIGLRTFLSTTLTYEAEGRWPWEQAPPDAAVEPAAVTESRSATAA
jgi:uncharacterized membrane protein